MEFLAGLYTLLLVTICLLLAVVLWKLNKPRNGGDYEELKRWRKCAVVDDLNPSGLGSTGMSKLSELLAQPTEDGVLILTVRGSARQFAKKEAAATKLLNLCDKAGGVCRFAAMTRGDVGKFARQTALRLGCVLEPEEAALLADYCNLDSLRLRQEVEKLAAYHCYTGKILKDDVPLVEQCRAQMEEKALCADRCVLLHFYSGIFERI